MGRAILAPVELIKIFDIERAFMVFAKILVSRYKIERCFLKPAIILAIDFAGQKNVGSNSKATLGLTTLAVISAISIPQLVL